MKNLYRFYKSTMPRIYQIGLFGLILNKNFCPLFVVEFPLTFLGDHFWSKNLIVPKIFSMKILFLAEKYFHDPIPVSYNY